MEEFRCWRGGVSRGLQTLAKADGASGRTYHYHDCVRDAEPLVDEQVAQIGMLSDHDRCNSFWVTRVIFEIKPGMGLNSEIADSLLVPSALPAFVGSVLCH